MQQKHFHLSYFPTNPNSPPTMNPTSLYFDYNATTPPAPSVSAAVARSMTEHWGNPSSSYGSGATAKAALTAAREEVAAAVGAEKAEEITFTSGGTEVFKFILDQRLC